MIKLLFIEDNEIDLLFFRRYLKINQLPIEIFHTVSNVADLKLYMQEPAFQEIDVIVSDLNFHDGRADEFLPLLEGKNMILATGALVGEKINLFREKYNMVIIEKDVHGKYVSEIVAQIQKLSDSLD